MLAFSFINCLLKSDLISSSVLKYRHSINLQSAHHQTAFSTKLNSACLAQHNMYNSQENKMYEKANKAIQVMECSKHTRTFAA